MRSVVFALACVPGVAWAEDFRVALPVVAAEVFPFGALTVLEAELEVPAGAHLVRALVPGEVLGHGWPLVAGAVLRGVSVGANTAFDPAEFDISPVAAARLEVEAAEAGVVVALGAVEALVAELDALEVKEAFLRSVTGGETLASAEELLSVAAALAAELAAISEARRGIDGELPAAEEAVEVAEAALARAEAGRRALRPAESSWRLLTLDIAAEEAGLVTVSLPSFTGAAGWSIAYEAVLDEDLGQVTLARNVTVQQGGPLPWVGAEVSLSTADPFSALEATEVGRSIARIVDTAPVAALRGVAETDSVGATLEAPMMAPAPAFEVARVDADGAVIRYDLPGPLTVLPDGEGAQVALTSLVFEAERYLAASPRFDDTAFVMADITNESGEPILPGAAFLYRGDALVGEGSLQLIPAGRETTLGFGPERDIALDVAFLDELSGDRGIIRGQETREDAIRLSARNLGGEPHAVRLRYAVPTSQQEDLEVRVEMSPEPSTRDADDLLGVMEWELDLAPGDEEVIELEFDLRWPEGQQLLWRP
ncbi:MAG: DUF4139 domain-containing protein [Pseudomonadota bacterium]